MVKCKYDNFECLKYVYRCKNCGKFFKEFKDYEEHIDSK